MPTPPDPLLLKKISDAVDAARETTVALHRTFVQAQSVTGAEGPMSAAVVAALAARGLEVESWAATAAEIQPYLEHVGEQEGYEGRMNVAGRRRGTGGGRSLLLNAHIDTVPPGDPALWSQPPFAANVVDGKVYGRGSCDMKGGLVTHITALDALAAAGIRLKGDVTVTATVGEEDGGLGALSTVLRGYRADAVLVTEPTELTLVTACEGSLVFRLTIIGRSAHAATRDEGVSALEKFMAIFLDLQAFERDRNARLRHRLYNAFENKVPINVGVVRCGNWASTVPERLDAEIRIGFLPGEEMQAFKRVVAERIFSVAEQDPWLKEHPPVITYFGGQFVAAETPTDAPICEAIRSAHHAVTGTQVRTVGVTYGADMRHFIVFGGMPCVMYGAGDIKLAHAPDEYLPIAELLTAIKVEATLLAEWCGVA
ncbi:MAG: ArgE/DapE family deacylase [Gemmatimonadales bacterium]